MPLKFGKSIDCVEIESESSEHPKVHRSAEAQVGIQPEPIVIAKTATTGEP
jgi:hypothetical protein